MNHQPFESWLLSGETLSPEDELALTKHVRACEKCRALESDLQQVDQLFAGVEMVNPPSGFVNRWQARLVQEKQNEAKKRYLWQTRIMLVLLLNGLAAAMLLLGYHFSGFIAHPNKALYQLVTSVTSILSVFGAINRVVVTMLRTIPPLVNPSVWGLLGVSMIFGCFAWFFALQKYFVTKQKVRL